MKIIIALLLLSSTFSLADSVSAEPAWILWTQDETPPNYDDPWKVRGSYTTQSACVSQQKVLWDKTIKEWGHCGKQVNCEVSTELNIIYVDMNPIHTKSGLLDEEYSRKEQEAEKAGKPHKIFAYKFLCLPDTVDPRERKP